MALLHQSQPRPVQLPIARAQLTPQQQLEALRRVQVQAEQRVQLGKQLLLAAESQTNRYQRLVEQVNADRLALREQMQQEMQATLLAANEKFDAAEDRVAQAIERLEKRVEQLESQWAAAAERLEATLSDAQARLDAVRQSMIEMPEADGDAGPVAAASMDDVLMSMQPPSPTLSYRELMGRLHERQEREAR